jgi:extensin-like protein
LARALVIAMLLCAAAPAAAETPAERYALMSQDECEAELVARQVPFVREPPTKGVRAPVRLTGPLHGVLFRTDLPDRERATTIWEIADCRLVLALDDFAEILARHDVVEVRHYSIYRKPSKAWPEGKEATRHLGGLAIDAGRFVRSDRTVIDIDDDYHGRRGSRSCGPNARPPRPRTEKAVVLRALLCEAVDRHLFNVVLTPNYNRRHHNHFHLEVTAGVRWFFVH